MSDFTVNTTLSESFVTDIQKKLNAQPNITVEATGVWDEQTTKGLQKFLDAKVGVVVPQTGSVDRVTVMGLLRVALSTGQ